MLRLRIACADDVKLLRTLLYEAAFWRPGVERQELDQALADPELARYVEGFGLSGDFGVVAEQDAEPLGAAWWRHLTADSPGYGFIDEATPEVSLAVFPSRRGRGVGTALLRALLSEAREREVAKLSLSVERDNPAVALYRRLGFSPVGRGGGAMTMMIALR